VEIETEVGRGTIVRLLFPKPLPGEQPRDGSQPP